MTLSLPRNTLLNEASRYFDLTDPEIARLKLLQAHGAYIVAAGITKLIEQPSGEVDRFTTQILWDGCSIFGDRTSGYEELQDDLDKLSDISDFEEAFYYYLVTEHPDGSTHLSFNSFTRE